jgi:hypothetical protein
MNRIILIVIGIVCAVISVVTGCVSKNIAVNKDEDALSYREKHVDDIRESVFRYQFENTDEALVNKNTSDIIYFISIGGVKRNQYKDVDPSDSFMERFKSNIPLVKKVSRCTTDILIILMDKKTGEKKVIEVSDKETRRKGLIFRVNDITWLSDSEVLVEGSYFAGNLAGSGNTYRVILKDGKWVVVEDTIKWVS